MNNTTCTLICDYLGTSYMSMAYITYLTGLYIYHKYHLYFELWFVSSTTQEITLDDDGKLDTDLKDEYNDL